MRFHIHYSSRSRDCDGPLDRYVDYQPDREDIDWADNLDVVMNFVMPLVFQVPDVGPVHIEIMVDDDGRYVVEGGQPTSEGFHAEAYVVCGLDDLEPGESQRDYFAEAAGY